MTAVRRYSLLWEGDVGWLPFLLSLCERSRKFMSFAVFDKRNMGDQHPFAVVG